MSTPTAEVVMSSSSLMKNVPHVDAPHINSPHSPSFEILTPHVKAPPILTGQKAIVTGASSGIGQGIAISYAQAGCDVLINYSRGREGAEKTAEEVRKLGRKAFLYGADVSKEDQVRGMFEYALEHFGRLVMA